MDFNSLPNGYANSFSAADFSDRDAGAGGGLVTPMNLALGSVNIENTVDNLVQSIMNFVADGEESTQNSDLRKRFVELAALGFYKSVEELAKPIDANSTVLGTVDVIRTLGRKDFNPSSKLLFRDLVIDLSDNMIYDTDSEKALINLHEQYASVLTKLFKADEELRNLTINFNNLSKRIDDFISLEVNSASDEMYKSFTNYLVVFFDNNKMLEKFNRFLQLYREFNRIRKLLGLRNVINNNEQSPPLCSICITNSVGCAFVPCGHTFCGSCSYKQTGNCYVCRTKISARIKLYFS
jgi:hypothetical protein